MAKKPAPVKKTTKPATAKTAKKKLYMSKRATILVGAVLFISVTAASYFGYKKWEQDNLIANAAFTTLGGNSTDAVKLCKISRGNNYFDVVWVIDKKTLGSVFWANVGIRGAWRSAQATNYGAQVVYGSRYYNMYGGNQIDGQFTRLNDNYNMGFRSTQIWNLLNC